MGALPVPAPIALPHRIARSRSSPERFRNPTFISDPKPGRKKETKNPPKKQPQTGGTAPSPSQARAQGCYIQAGGPWGCRVGDPGHCGLPASGSLWLFPREFGLKCIKQEVTGVPPVWRVGKLRHGTGPGQGMGWEFQPLAAKVHANAPIPGDHLRRVYCLGVGFGFDHKYRAIDDSIGASDGILRPGRGQHTGLHARYMLGWGLCVWVCVCTKVPCSAAMRTHRPRDPVRGFPLGLAPIRGGGFHV